MLRLNILLIFIHLVFSYSKCSKTGDCLNEKFTFLIYSRATPDFDSINVNDTIWMEVSESVILQDLNSNQSVSFANAANLGTAIGIEELLGNGQRRDAVANFNYLLLSGIETVSVNPARFKEYLFKEESNRYLFKLGVVPISIGVFRIGFSDAANVYQRGRDCTKAYFKILMKDTDQHLYFNDINFGITTPFPSNMYCFKVK